MYFLADAAFMTIAKPISDWLAKHVVLRQLCAWIRSLRPYPSLALFLIPVIILEPIKPVRLIWLLPLRWRAVSSH